MDSVEEGKGQMDTIISEINRRTELTYFFEELINPDSVIPRIFLLHRHDLLPGYEQMDIMIPVIFWINKEFRKSELTGVDTLSTFRRLSELETTKSWDTMEHLFSFFKKEFGSLFQSLLKENPELAERFLKEAFEIEKTESKEYKIPKDFDPKQIENRFETLIKNVRDNPLRYLNTLTNLWPDISLYLHLESQNIVKKLLENAGLDFTDYEKTISQLFTLDLISSLDTIFWCHNCAEPVVLRSKSQLSPRSFKMKCIKCDKKMAVCSIYNLDNFLWNLISSRNGLLGVTIAWLLKKRKIEYDLPLYIKKTELDFLCHASSGEILLECKMHRVPSTERSVRQKLVNDIKQLQEHVSKFETDTKAEIKESYLIYNLEISRYQDIVEEKMENLQNIHLIDFTSLDEVISSIAPREWDFQKHQHIRRF